MKSYFLYHNFGGILNEKGTYTCELKRYTGGTTAD